MVKRFSETQQQFHSTVIQKVFQGNYDNIYHFLVSYEDVTIKYEVHVQLIKF